jgi:hypothetical protein
MGGRVTVQLDQESEESASDYGGGYEMEVDDHWSAPPASRGKGRRRKRGERHEDEDEEEEGDRAPRQASGRSSNPCPHSRKGQSEGARRSTSGREGARAGGAGRGRSKGGERGVGRGAASEVGGLFSPGDEEEGGEGQPVNVEMGNDVEEALFGQQAGALAVPVGYEGHRFVPELEAPGGRVTAFGISVEVEADWLAGEPSVFTTLTTKLLSVAAGTGPDRTLSDEGASEMTLCLEVISLHLHRRGGEYSPEQAAAITRFLITQLPSLEAACAPKGLLPWVKRRAPAPSPVTTLPLAFYSSALEWLSTLTPSEEGAERPARAALQRLARYVLEQLVFISSRRPRPPEVILTSAAAPYERIAAQPVTKLRLQLLHALEALGPGRVWPLLESVVLRPLGGEGSSPKEAREQVGHHVRKMMMMLMMMMMVMMMMLMMMMMVMMTDSRWMT